MIPTQLIEQLQTILPLQYIKQDEPMCQHSYFKIGGPADLLVMPGNIEQTVAVYELLKSQQLPITWLGNGSNILVSDKGIRGAVIKIAEPFSQIVVQDTKMIVDAGALLSTTANTATAHSLTGFEFASGIPGTIGGAVFMNAGAYGGEMVQVTTAVTVLTPAGEVKRLSGDELAFRYRGSNIQDLDYIALRVELALSAGNRQDIQAMVDELTVKRTTKQPLYLPSAGSTFKRPEGYYASKLIQDSGLRGVRFGDAAVSEKHCGFVVNLGKASCQDVLTLIRFIQKTVLDTFGVKLSPEVRMIGEGL